jgi:cytochrome c biogenesis protein CcmG/thiol:disulfide interchange protein DsbE
VAAAVPAVAALVRKLADLRAGGRHWVRWVAIAVALPVALLLGVLATRDPAGTRAADSPLLGKPAPAIDTTTLDGTPFQLSQYRGQWVLLNFFATWCLPCRQEHPDLVQFAARHRELGDAAVLGVVYDDTVDAVRGFVQKEGGAWPMVVDPKSRIALDFGVAGVPESYLITPGGAVAAKLIGGVQAGALEDLLNKVKAATPPGA